MLVLLACARAADLTALLAWPQLASLRIAKDEPQFDRCVAYQLGLLSAFQASTRLNVTDAIYTTRVCLSSQNIADEEKVRRAQPNLVDFSVTTDVSLRVPISVSAEELNGD